MSREPVSKLPSLLGRGWGRVGPSSQFYGPAFTLIELLVVVAIIALLISLLVPAMNQARATSKLIVCGSNLKQLGYGIHAYASANVGFIPRGPAPTYPQDFTGNQVATNQLWIGAGPYDPPPNRRQYQGLGPLLETACPDSKVYFCPSDDNFNLSQSQPNIGTENSAYGSYTYRQLDRLPADMADGLLDRMGANEVDGVSIPVEALALDTNSLGPEALRAFHTNHGGRAANVLFRDASVRRFASRDNCLAIPPEAFAGFPNMTGVMAGLDQLLTNADYAYRGGGPGEAPRLDSMRVTSNPVCNRLGSRRASQATERCFRNSLQTRVAYFAL